MADKTVIHDIETLVIEWCHQVRAVLKKDSSEALLEDQNPTPDTELLFWKNRSAPRRAIKTNRHNKETPASTAAAYWRRRAVGPPSWTGGPLHSVSSVRLVQ